MRIFYIIPIILLLLGGYEFITDPPKQITDHTKIVIKGNTKLINHTKTFDRQIIQYENIYFAIGFGLANSIMIEGEDGIIIIDTLESIDAATVLYGEYRKITNKPVKAIIYTHYHADHIFGTKVFMEGRSDVKIYAHKNTIARMNDINGLTQEIEYYRGVKQLGKFNEHLINCGIGDKVRFGNGERISIVYPTDTFDTNLNITIAGIDLELYHVQGETDDQINIYMPKLKVYFSGDNYYKSFPNLYTIRGTRARDVKLWINALDFALSKDIEVLMPGHTLPIYGKENITNVLKNYRTAIKYVHDRTVYYMNKRMHVDEIVERVKLPDELAELDYLQEFYGKVEWSVRAVFSNELGWFSGDVKDLHPLNAKQYSELVVGLVGGDVDVILESAYYYYNNSNYKYALELVDILENDIKYTRDVIIKKEEVINLKKKILLGMAMLENNANAYNYYMSTVYELEGGVIEPGIVEKENILLNAPMKDLLELLSRRLYRRIGVDVGLNFNITDTGECFLLTVNKNVCDVYDRCSEEYPMLTTNRKAWITIILEDSKVGIMREYVNGNLVIKSKDLFYIVRFFNLFDRSTKYTEIDVMESNVDVNDEL